MINLLWNAMTGTPVGVDSDGDPVDAMTPFGGYVTGKDGPLYLSRYTFKAEKPKALRAAEILEEFAAEIRKACDE